ncbi:AAA family ATPase [Sphingorhabdus sp.]|uniref:AAA family ATPase n=1 Tax=Sphingorhabdus sp. TaxID=1902408 RepID=UPI0039832228
MQAADVPSHKLPIETSVVRFIRTRLQVTHEDRAICVISGPWGIGKTTAVEAFARANVGQCIIVKIEQGSMKHGASPVFVMQQTLEALRPLVKRSPRATLSNAYWSLRQMLYKCTADWLSQWRIDSTASDDPTFSIVFDEAQYLSRESIEMLRFWNDVDRTVMPFPIGLAFVGNSEFALEEKPNGLSILSGAVRSRSLFVETLSYNDVSDDDISSFLRACGSYDADALSFMLGYFRRPRVRRDFRTILRLDASIRRRSPDSTISIAAAQSVLG